MRDSDGDGKVDQWWTWPNPDTTECAVITSDHNGDGKPDPSNVIDVCSLRSPARRRSVGDRRRRIRRRTAQRVTALAAAPGSAADAGARRRALPACWC